MRKHRETLEHQCAKLHHAYLEDWHRSKDDPATQLLQIMLRMLKDSEDAMAARVQYQRAVFLQQKELPRLHAKPFSIRLQFHESHAFTGTTLRKGTSFYVQGEQLYPITLNEDIGLSHAFISDVYLYEGSTARIEHPMIQNKIPLFMYEGDNQQVFSLSFDAINLVNGMPKGDILVYIKGKDQQESIAIVSYFASHKVSWEIRYEEAVLHDVNVIVEDDHLRFFLNHAFGLENNVLHFKAIVKNTMDLPSFMLTGITFTFPDKKASLQSVLVNEVEQKKDAFALFDAPLSLFQSCYMRSDDTFTHRDSMMRCEFQLDVAEYVAGSELIEQKEYRTFMRRLPKHQIIYEVFADQVQLEYFHGEWVCIPNILFQQEDFQAIGVRHRFEFLCPADMLPYTVGGEEAYWFRFVLTKAENCYQIPAHHHIPIFKRMRIASSYQNKTYPAQHICVHANLKKTCLEDEAVGQVMLWEVLTREKNSIYLCIDGQEIFSPFRIYVQMKEELSTNNVLTWYIVGNDGKEQIVNVEDHTSGFSRSGLLSIFFPKHIAQQVLFSKKGYWIRVERQSCHPFYNRICSMEAHCVFATATVYEEQEYLLTMEEQSVVMDVEKEVQQVFVKESEKWIAWKLRHVPTTNVRELYQQGQTLLLLRRNFYKTEVDLAQIHVKVKYYLPLPAMQLEENTTVFPAMADPVIASVQTKGTLIQKEESEDDEHFMCRISHHLAYKNTMATSRDIEIMLPLQFLDIDTVKCLMNQDQNGRKQKGTLSVYVLWRDIETSVFTQHVQNIDVKEYLLQKYPFLVYQIQLQVYEPQYLYCEVLLEIMEKDLDMDHIIQEACLSYLHPIHGNENQKGWGIGKHPNSKQVLRYVKEQFQTTVFLTCTIKVVLQEDNHRVVRCIEDFHELASGVLIPQEVILTRREMKDYESA